MHQLQPCEDCAKDKFTEDVSVKGRQITTLQNIVH